MNRLRQSSSPYLLQHEDNPVHWREWGPDALEAAQRDNKPIFLSIGYAACHWCHVMAHESFEDDETADVLNQHFISIKVDREERPDVDHVYMSALHALGVQGGWPLSMFLKPDGTPFWGGTYFPKVPRYGQPAFTQVLQAIANLYQTEPDKVDRNGSQLHRILTESQAATTGQIQFDDLESVAQSCLNASDPIHGGTQGAPKFPNAPFLEVLLRAFYRTQETRYAIQVDLTLSTMGNGGLYDHLGGGFARYCVDEIWLVPHFEKMLYDNAQLLRLMAYAPEAHVNPLLAEKVDETIAWLERDMAVDGGYASSLDADSEGVEGKYYVWSPEEIADVLGSDAEAFCGAYDITAHGNFESKSIPNRLKSKPQFGAESEDRMRENRKALRAARENRIAPARDDKVLADWNGYLVEALAVCGFRFARPDWLAEADRLFKRVLTDHRTPQQGLIHARRAGRGDGIGLASDYAALISAGITLFSFTGDVAFLRDAEHLADDLLARYWSEPGGLFMTAADDNDVIVRPLAGTDEATPSASGLAAQALYRLHALTGKSHYRDRADQIVERFADQAKRNVFGSTSIWNAVDTARGSRVVGLLLPADQDTAQSPFAASLREHLDPNLLILPISDESIVPPKDHPLHGKTRVDDQPTAYVCTNDRCLAPATTDAELTERLATAF